MIEFLTANLAPIMFASLVLFLLIGYPVSFSLAANGILFGLIGIELGLLRPGLFGAIPERIFGVMSNDTLLAIPFFTFMGLILERSGMAEDLLDTIGQLFGPLRGGLAIAVILVGALLAATTGVVAASVISMGLISLPIMMRYGYSPRVASGVIMASGTLAQIVPPSLVLIIMADQLGRPVGALYAGALIPAMCLTGLYLAYVIGITLLRPKLLPALPKEARNLGDGVSSLLVLLLIAVLTTYGLFKVWPRDELNPNRAAIWAACIGFLVIYLAAHIHRVLKKKFISYLAQQVILVLMPPLALIFLVLGTIFMGLATPTEGGAMGACGALIMALFRRKMTMPLLRQAMDSTAKLSTFVMFILIGSGVFSLTFYGISGHLWVEHLLINLPGGEIGFLVFVNSLVFMLGFFIDFFEIAFILLPLLAPVAVKLGIDLVWFGVVLGINLQSSFLTPPFGFALFYLRSVAPKSIKTIDIYRGAIPFVCLQVLMVVLVVVFPQLVTWNLDKKIDVDLDTIKIEVPTESGDGDFDFGTPIIEGNGNTNPEAPGAPAASPSVPETDKPPEEAAVLQGMDKQVQ